jgi:hypothetical protein
MPLSRRYSPEWAPGEKSSIGMDFCYVIPPGVGISSGSLAIFTNAANSVDASGDFTGPNDPVHPTFFDASVLDRVIYLTLTGGVSGKDYRFTWTALDTDGNEWPRTALLLCAPTS